MEILIIYGSNTGNTFELISYMKEQLKLSNAKIKILNSKDINSTYSIEEKYDLVILSCSTWGIEPAVMQEDFARFWNFLNKSTIFDKKFAIIGLGDNYYPNFCYALDLITNEIEKYGGKLVINILPISDPWINKKQEILKWLKILENLLLSY